MAELLAAPEPSIAVLLLAAGLALSAATVQRRRADARTATGA